MTGQEPGHEPGHEPRQGATGRDEPPVDPDLAEPLRASNPNANGPEGAAGGTGVSSERVGHAGPGQTGTDGMRDNAVTEPAHGTPGDVPPEQSAGGPEDNPDGVTPKAGYSSKDPRSKDHPFDAKPDL